MTHFDYIKKIYYDLYINHNLKIALKYFKSDWTTILDIKNNPNIVSPDSNSYLQDENHELLLVKDILDNGMYWPIFLNDDNIVCEGCHRIAAMKKKYKNGVEWPQDKPILTIYKNKELEKATKIISRNTLIKSLNDMNKEDKETFKNIKIEDEYVWVNPNKTSIKYLNGKINSDCEIFKSPIGDFYKVKINDQCALFFSLIQIHILIREEMYAHECLNNPIKPSSIINNQKNYYKWKKGEIQDVEESYNLVKEKLKIENKYIYSDLLINGINISNLIDIHYMDNKLVKVICDIHSNLVNLINFNEVNTFTINNKEFKIEYISRCSCAHSLIHGFTQNLVFKIGE